MQNFKSYESIGYRDGKEIEKVIEVVAGRFIGENPRLPFTYRAFSEAGFMQIPDGRVNIDIGNRYPDAKNGQFAYAMASIYLDSPLNNFDLGLNCYGPTIIYHNGKHTYTSSTYEEVDSNYKQIVYVDMVQGWNVFFLKMEKAPTGFGCIFGSARDNLNPMRYYSPFKDRAGQGGFIYSELCGSDIFEDRDLPVGNETEQDSGLKWLPEIEWDEFSVAKKQMHRIYGSCDKKQAVGITEFETDYINGSVMYRFEGECAGETTIWLDEEEVLTLNGGKFAEDVEIRCGKYRVTVKSMSTQTDFGFELKIFTDNDVEVEFISPLNVKGCNDKWVYTGPFAEDANISPADFFNISKLIDNGEGGEVYYRLDMPDMAVRPYIDSILYGRWNYPLGVTLYGLLRAGKALNRQDISDYAHSHIKMCVDVYKYGLWDEKKYGYPSVDQKLIELFMLDDCGSCGSTMLEAYFDCKDERYIEIAKIIADFIENKVDRRSDGALYRVQPEKFHHNTMWADDLYMSVPFLSRYYKITGEKKYIDDAANQFMLFKKYLYMEDKRIMSHVYDFKYNTKNGLAWGRGNGWVLFSLTELLEKLPEEHELSGDLVNFFREFSGGVLDLQGENGLWHQLLTDNASYEETSCTCMFIYAFSRGIRLGIFKDDECGKYYKAVQKAWDGLCDRAVDYKGNVYGVCWGSRYAFKPSYYTKELGCAKNDTHGTGIVMLAGIEYKNVTEFLKKTGK